MKRLRRWLFNGFAVLSLLLCVTTVALWIRSYSAEESLLQFLYLPPDMNVVGLDFQPRSDQRFTDISILQGDLLIARTLRPVDYSHPYEGWTRLRKNLVGPQLNPQPSLRNGFGFDFGSERPADYPGASSWRLLFPLWAITVLTAIAPIRLTSLLCRRKVKIGHCEKCGYDLRPPPADARNAEQYR